MHIVGALSPSPKTPRHKAKTRARAEPWVRAGGSQEGANGERAAAQLESYREPRES